MMTDAELQHLSGMLHLQRHAVVRMLCAAVDERMLEPAFVHLLTDIQTAIAAVENKLTEGKGGVR